MRHRLWLAMLAICLWSASVQSQETSDSSVYFFKRTPLVDDATSRLCWLDAATFADEICVEAPTFDKYAVAPNGQTIALRQQKNGNIHLFDIPTQTLINLSLCEPAREFLVDRTYLQAGSLLWSPDGAYLALAGASITTEDTDDTDDTACDDTSRVDVYRYTLATGAVQNLTAEIPIVDALITPTNWSSDGAWMGVYGAWSQDGDEDTPSPHWQTGILSSDGSQFVDFGEMCRLRWSPDDAWIISLTTCTEPLGTGSAIVALPFAPQASTEDGRRLVDLLAPLRFDWRETDSWRVRYDEPQWMSDTEFIAYRSLSPTTLGYFPDYEDKYRQAGFVRIDLETYSETVVYEVASDANVYPVNGWFLIAAPDADTITAWHPSQQKTFSFSQERIDCPITSSFTVASDGSRLAVWNGCATDASARTIRFYATDDMHLAHTLTSDATHTLQPLGFRE